MCKKGVCVMSSNVNNNQPSFHGMYILKGSAKSVRAASEMIKDRCGGEYAKIREHTTKFLGETKSEKQRLLLDRI